MTFIYFLRQDKVLLCRTVGLKLTAAVLVPRLPSDRITDSEPPHPSSLTAFYLKQ